jgi:hypothetical protein
VLPKPPLETEGLEVLVVVVTEGRAVVVVVVDFAGPEVVVVVPGRGAGAGVGGAFQPLGR